jgi:hypothetical protein
MSQNSHNLVGRSFTPAGGFRPPAAPLFRSLITGRILVVIIVISLVLLGSG